MTRRIAILLLCGLGLTADDKLLTGPPNAASQRNKPYVLLIGLDGYRPDYVDKYKGVTLKGFGERGAKAEALVPSFPSTTFPNFYTMVTGMRPQSHGLVSMQFYDRQTRESFSYTRNAADGKWFSGAVPLWNLAEKQGMRSASYFWVGTEAAIRGERPSAWYPYNAGTSSDTKVEKVLEWLRLPEERRPHFITLYFSQIDGAGHRFGPDTPQVEEAVQQVDRALANLFRSLEKVQPAVNVIIVSDHGMVAPSKQVDLTNDADWSGVRVVNGGTMVLVYSPDKDKLAQLEAQLKAKRSPEYRVYRRAQLPKHLYYRDNPRNGDLILLATGTQSLYVRSATASEKKRGDFTPLAGMHGYDPKQVPLMHGILYGAGPNLKPGVKLGMVDNIEVFGLAAKILGIPVPAGANAGRDLVKRWYRETR
jgi:predicted AlkP superfamily pyrophosphatase or phosphodiesterase